MKVVGNNNASAFFKGVVYSIKKGESYDLPDILAKDLIKAGHAKKAGSGKKKTEATEE